MITSLFSEEELKKWTECVNNGWYSDINNIDHPNDLYWSSLCPLVSKKLYDLYDEEKICFMYKGTFITVSYIKEIDKKSNIENPTKLRIVYSDKILAANMKIRFIK